MLDRTFIESNRPVRRVVADRSWNGESLWQLCVDTDLIGQIHAFSKLAFNTLPVLRVTVSKNIVLHIFLCMICFGKIRVLFCGKDGAVIGSIGLIVGDLFHDHGCFLFVD